VPASSPATTDRSSRLAALFGEAGFEFAPRVLSEPRDLRDRDPSAGRWQPHAVACRPAEDALEHAARAGLGACEGGGPRAEHVLWGSADAWRQAATHPQLALAALALEAAAERSREVQLMGVLNVTPDSFSDGGRYDDPARAVERGLELLEAGATWLDVGGESTRPGADTVPPDEERRRTEGVVRELRRLAPEARISIDTRKSTVAAAALDAGADLVNDVSGGQYDPRVLEVVAEGSAQLALMHMQGEPRTMQRDPRYEAVVADVTESLRHAVARALDAGIGLERLWVDPGIGFGKRLDDNLDLIERVHELHSLGLPLLVGVSRKSFLGTLTGVRDAHRRVLSTAVAVASCVRSGAQVLRVHDVAEMREAVAVAAALRSRHVGHQGGGSA
jgi:dihydropteroate synthase